MQNFELLKAVGSINKPVLLKRGLAATLEEFIHAAEYIMSQGNDQIMLCERGIRTYERATRNTLDISAVPILKQETHLPVFVDVTHSTGRRDILITCCKSSYCNWCRWSNGRGSSRSSCSFIGCCTTNELTSNLMSFMIPYKNS